MTLTDLMKAAQQLDRAIEISSESFDNDVTNRLMIERDCLNAYASHLRPTTDDEFRFLQALIVEYAQFISDIPTHEIARIEALEAIKRMSDTLAGVMSEEVEERIAA